MSTSALIQAVATSSLRRCEQCDRVDATVWLRADVTRFSGAVCDGCALHQIARVAEERGTYTLDRVAGVVLMTTIPGINIIADYVRECLDGVTGDCDLAAMTTVPGAQTAIAIALSSRLRRPLSPSEMLGVLEATRTEVVRRYHEKRQGLLEIQRALHAPFGSGLRQKVG